MHTNNGRRAVHAANRYFRNCRELMPTGDLPRAVHEGYHGSRGDIP